jgi:hypothetical protein
MVYAIISDVLKIRADSTREYKALNVRNLNTSFFIYQGGKIQHLFWYFLPEAHILISPGFGIIFHMIFHKMRGSILDQWPVTLVNDLICKSSPELQEIMDVGNREYEFKREEALTNFNKIQR